MKKPLYRVTDHALVRYLERVEGVDVEALRRKIGHTIKDGVEQGASGVVHDGFVYRLEGNSVVTIAPHNQPICETCRKRKGRKSRG